MSSIQENNLDMYPQRYRYATIDDFHRLEKGQTRLNPLPFELDAVESVSDGVRFFIDNWEIAEKLAKDSDEFFRAPKKIEIIDLSDAH